MLLYLCYFRRYGIQFMDPLRHISLVKELGIDWCIPRMLLAVKPAQLARVTISPAVESTASKNLVVKAAATPLVKKSTPKIDFGLEKPKIMPQTAQAINFKQRPRLVMEKIDSFNLLVASSGSLVFVTDVKSSPLTAVWERSVRQFFDEIDRACSSTDKKVQSLDYFSWPIAGSGNQSLGEDQLIQLLTGFMRQRIIGDKKGVILFGDNAKQYGTSVVLSMNGLQVIAAPALGVMFTSVTAKAALWRDLQALPIGKG
ncbi:MAG: hypothetical protein ACJASL_000415 [Paraglaciecola sp.]|jgi:hypothetical protein